MATSKTDRRILKVSGPSKYRKTKGVGLDLTQDLQNDVIDLTVHTGVDAKAFKALTESFKVVNQVGYDTKDRNSRTRWVQFLAEVTIFEDDEE